MPTVKKLTSLRLNQKLYAHIEILAKKQNRSINNLIETILMEATNFNDDVMSKIEYKTKLINSKESGRISLSMEEENELFS